jgi:YidC/Oxa1 family membrane protein insertase
MWKRLLPIALIVISFNLIIYYFWGPQNRQKPSTTPKQAISALSVPMVNDTYDQSLSIQNKDVRWSVSMRTGQIYQWTLLHYHHSSNHKYLSLLDTEKGYAGMGLFSRDSGTLVPVLPESIVWDNAQIRPGLVVVSSAGGNLVETYKMNGNVVILRFHFLPSGYLISSHLENPSHANVVFGSGLNFGVSALKQTYGTEFQGPVYEATGKFQEMKKDGSLFFDSGLKWVGNEDKYFIG